MLVVVLPEVPNLMFARFGRWKHSAVDGGHRLRFAATRVNGFSGPRCGAAAAQNR
jgi:hypothetical protein